MKTDAWHTVAALVFIGALVVAYALTTGQLDPIGSAYYGVVVDSRNAVLFSLLAALELVFLVDAMVLGWRRRSVGFWALLGFTLVLLPVSLVTSMARIDLWRYDQAGSADARAIAGAAMVLLIGTAFFFRQWLWRSTAQAALRARLSA